MVIRKMIRYLPEMNIVFVPVMARVTGIFSDSL